MASVELPSAGAAWGRRLGFARERFFRERYEHATVGVALSVGFAALTGLAAQVSIRTPFSPIPITLQVLLALVSGVVLGYRWGTFAQLLYVVLGAFALPWYAPAAGHGVFSTGGAMAGSLSGIAQLTGGAGGYIVAFPVAAFLVGFCSDRYPNARGIIPQLAIMMIGVGVIYLFGAIGFWIAFHSSFSVVLQEAVILFIPVDLAKAALAGFLGTGITPKRAFGPESPKAAGFHRWWPVLR